MENRMKHDGDRKKGTLYLCATPIGNLEDMTYRAVRVLGEAPLIAAEDTRRTRQLLAHFGISTRMVPASATRDFPELPTPARSWPPTRLTRAFASCLCRGRTPRCPH